MTLLDSDDGGASFSRASRKPLLAAPIRQPTGQTQTLGFKSPSNIVELAGWKYALAQSAGGGSQKPGICLLRSQDPLRPDDWQVFRDGKFVNAGFDPYAGDAVDEPRCSPLPGLRGIVWSLVRHKKSGLYVAVLTTFKPGTREIRLATSVSRDLLTWTPPRIETDIAFQWNSNCPQDPAWHYPSLLDPDGSGRNFDTVGDDAFLFLTRLKPHDCKGSLDRDLVRFPVKISISGSQ